MDKILFLITGILSVSLIMILIRYFGLKKQLRNISSQITLLAEGKTDKVLDISLLDRDLEMLAGEMNRYIERERGIVAESEKQEDYLKDSVANISHDLRTPLTVILGHIQILEKSVMPDDQRERLKVISSKAVRMKELVDSFYDLSVLDSGGDNPDPEKINLSNMIFDYLADFAPALEERKIEPEVKLPEKSVFIETDRGMLERILQNLFTNAVRYSSGILKIELDTIEEGGPDHIRLVLSNSVKSGTELDPDLLFERFYTGDRSRHDGSTGLGLAVVRLLTEKLGGSVHAGLKNDLLKIVLVI